MNIKAFDVALVPATMGITEVIKSVGLPSKYAPVVSLGVGIILGVVTSPGEALRGVLTGIAIGLSASGLYSGTKALMESDEDGQD